MEFKIISFGKFPKISPHKDLFNEYKKRISCRIDLIELKKESNVKNKVNNEKVIIDQYSGLLKDFIILDKKGLNLSSQNLSEYINRKMRDRYKQMVFFIGGADGLSSDLTNTKTCFSFGNQTWPHLLVRVMLIEQVYRALCILKSHPYHK